MANLNLFTHAGTFRRMKPEYLITWLTPAREYLAGRGFVLPAVAADGTNTKRQVPSLEVG